MFQFTQTTYAVGEGVGNAMISIELIDRELTFPIVVSVFDVAGGSATGNKSSIIYAIVV